MNSGALQKVFFSRSLDDVCERISSYQDLLVMVPSKQASLYGRDEVGGGGKVEDPKSKLDTGKRFDRIKLLETDL